MQQCSAPKKSFALCASPRTDAETLTHRGLSLDKRNCYLRQKTELKFGNANFI
jgi:hypothetical protein